MRNAYIAKQRDEHGRKAVAVLPVHYPKELFTALDLLAVEMWGPPGAPVSADAGRVQAYVCAVVRNALAFLASGRADACEAVLFPHTCDSIQGLATLLTDFGGWSKPSFVFQHPRGSARPSSRAYYLGELRALADGLAGLAGRPLAPERLQEAIRLHRRIDAARAALLDGRRRLALDDVELYRLLRRGEWLWPEDHLAELEAARAKLGPDDVARGVPVMITGYVPEPGTLFEVLGDAGAFVVADDYAAVGRRVVRAPAALDLDDPFLALAELYWAAPPCPTRASDQVARMRYLAELCERSGAAGVIVHEQKFCEPELFDVAAVKKTFAGKGAKLLYLEGELETELSGQATTRLEAFVEMITGTARVA
ncbi:MAG: 2-hydroxyacyl-CoA dehydratase [Polyangiaceae bacterium]|nr:2-hydroxyacyl-CoA dehydratase [Polyangiaceae bacterium]